MTRQVRQQYQPSIETSLSEESLGILVPQPVSAPSLPAEEKAAILKTRAQALARIPKRQGPEETGLSVIEFLVGEKTYAIESMYVREVQHFKELTPLPGTPPFVAGIINVRGRILAVLDIRPLLGLTSEASPSQDSVIILHAETREVGLLTDGLLGVRSIPLSQLHPLPSMLTGTKADSLRGVTGSQTIIVHAPQLLAAPTAPSHPSHSDVASADRRHIQSIGAGPGASSLPLTAAPCS